MNLVRFAARLVCVASAARGGGAETAETRGGVEHCEPWAFVHTPKAGGSTIIQKALQPRAKYATTYAVPAKFHHYMRDYFHVPAREQRNACEATPGCDWGDVNSFAVVRNPYDLTVSRFFYLAERCAKLGIEGLVCNYGGIVGKPDRNASHKCAFNARGPAGKIATCRGRVRGPRGVRGDASETCGTAAENAWSPRWLLEEDRTHVGASGDRFDCFPTIISKRFASWHTTYVNNTWTQTAYLGAEDGRTLLIKDVVRLEDPVAYFRGVDIP
mmetsp:Transcript_2327/g.6639  ORF Transcript_2327/g.6639 Transcript_2327/m.6639 type:complete len:271 (-) Transcript_2327:41-853(-)